MWFLGKIRFIGFSTHAMTPVILQAIETDIFDYVNLHYQFIGSYTSTGTGPTGSNLAAVEAARRHDMGVFIISPSDKGGALYAPSRTMYQECFPYTPLVFNNLFLWSVGFPENNGSNTEYSPHIHTLVIGAARPSDFDEHMYSASLHHKCREISYPIASKLHRKVTSVMNDESFLSTW